MVPRLALDLMPEVKFLEIRAGYLISSVTRHQKVHRLLEVLRQAVLEVLRQAVLEVLRHPA